MVIDLDIPLTDNPRARRTVASINPQSPQAEGRCRLADLLKRLA
jgi:hypothetical protein